MQCRCLGSSVWLEIIRLKFELLNTFLNSDPKFHQPLIVDGVDKSIMASFAILSKGCLFRVGLFIILCVVVAP